MNELELQKSIMQHMDIRFDQIEKLMTLSLINDISPQYANDLCENLPDDVKKVLRKRGFFITKTEIFSDCIAAYLKSNKKVGIREFRELKKGLPINEKKLIFVFEIEGVTPVQKKKFIDEKISYYIKGKELFIIK